MECRLVHIGLLQMYGDARCLICHMSTLDYIMKMSCKFLDGSSSQHVTTLKGLVTTGIVIWKFNVFKFVTWTCVTSCLKSHVTLWVGAPEGNSPSFNI